jgi:DNA polymerase elongation subunit (family B)
MTKKEILKELDNILTEYLQVKVTFSGKSFSKPVLEKHLQEYRKMIEIKRQAEELIKDYTDQQKLYAGLTGTDENYLQYCELLKQAQQIYYTDFRRTI